MTIIEHGKQVEFEMMLSDLYPDGATETSINDLLWFETDWIYNTLNITIED